MQTDDDKEISLPEGPAHGAYTGQVKEDNLALSDLIRSVGKFASWMIGLIPFGQKKVNGQIPIDDRARNQPDPQSKIRHN